nr:beta,beta-carotene 15,15'-dioxygenase-like [Lytechinus pictus]
MNIKDHPEGVQANIKGSIPGWLKGSFLRTGPGRFEVGESKYKHFFDGLALLHRFTFDNGSVMYHSRYLDSNSYQAAMKENRIVFTEFGTAGFPDPCLNIFSRAMSTFLTRLKFTDNCNVNWVRSGDQFYTITETPMIQKVDPVTLEKEETIDISKIISVFTGTAHPHQCPDETAYNLGVNFGARSTYNIIKLPPQTEGNDESIYKQASIALTIPTTDTYPSYSHSFFMTPNYFILVEQPLFINMIKLASLAVMGYSFLDVLDFCPDKPTRFHVVRRSDSTLLETKYVTEAQFFFHQINAFEKEGHIVLDMCSYKDNEIMKRLYLKPLQEDGLMDAGSLCKRYYLPIDVEGFQPGDTVSTMHKNETTAILEAEGTVFCKPFVLGELGMEMPRINYEKYNGKPYQYVYGIISSAERDNGIAKLNVDDGTNKQWYEDGCFPSEPVFIGTPEGQDEDDGIVLSSVINFNEGGCPFLLVLDAKTFTEIGRAEIPIEGMPYGIHGYYAEGI